METSPSKPTFANVLAFVVFGICLVVLIFKFSVGNFVTAQSTQVAAQDQRPSPANKYFFSGETPGGDWSGQAVFDMAQTNDSRVPIVIAGMRSYAGKGNWLKQVMIDSVVLNNHVSKPVSGIKFGWAFITEQALNERDNPDADLLRGYTEFYDLTLPGLAMRRIPLNLDFVKLAQPLIKNGALSGTLFLRLRVSEIRFEDGSIWTEKDLAQIKNAHVRALQLPTCPNTNCEFDQTGQGHCTATLTGAVCLRHPPCNPADPNACTCDVYACTQCKDLDGDGWYDCEGDCWDAAGNVNAFNTHPGAIEICDGMDNDCNGVVDDECEEPTPTPTPTPQPSR